MIKVGKRIASLELKNLDCENTIFNSLMFSFD
jgi:hypothetical protein